MTDGSRSAAPLTTPFGFESTAAEVVEGIDLTGKKAIITGGASGIGVETVRALANAGASVTLAVRRTGDGEKVPPASAPAPGTTRSPSPLWS